MKICRLGNWQLVAQKTGQRCDAGQLYKIRLHKIDEPQTGEGYSLNSVRLENFNPVFGATFGVDRREALFLLSDARRIKIVNK